MFALTDMDAYQLLKESTTITPMTQTTFDALVIRLRKDFLTEKNYAERLASHRRPAEYREEIRREIAERLQAIQRRPEMQDMDIENKTSGHVPTGVKAIWVADKQLRSCFAALEVYCRQRGSDIHVIGIHLAEYKAMGRLFQLIGRVPRVPKAILQQPSARIAVPALRKSAINFSSRYYEAFRTLRGMVDADHYLETHYNEDRHTTSFTYLFGNYLNHLEPVGLSQQVTARVIAYLADNLYRPEEVKLLLRELLPIAQVFGARATNSMETWADRATTYGDHVHATELRKSAAMLQKAGEFIYQDLLDYYSNLYTTSKSELSMKSKSQLQELVLDYFRKTNSRSGHVILMNVLRHNLLHKLNPKEQELFVTAVNELIEKGYLLYEKDSPECLRLTEKGYDRIYDDDFREEEIQPVIQKIALPTTGFADELYEDVLKTLSAYGRDIETKPRVYGGQDEEGLRDHFLTMLGSRYKSTTATGETFNKGGKTDIMLKDDQANNLFIAECKWWKGAGIFQNTISQLFDNYVTWRDTKLAVLFFVDNKDFSNVLDQIKGEAALHPYFVRFVSKRNDTDFSFIFRQKDDPSHQVKLEILFFHFPAPDKN
jgi:hypothetical protein